MVSAIAVLFALVLTILAAALIWVGTRRPSTIGHLTVSRQWLMQHQNDDHA
jgi:hypothetical protein